MTADRARKRITIDAPSEMVILAARHLDATEGPVQVGRTVDTAARSAITTVLRYIANAHNAPAVTGEKGVTRRPCRYCPDPLCPEDCPECGGPIHDLDAVPAQHHGDVRPEEPQPTATISSSIGEIQVTRQLGRGLIVDKAPARARMTLALLAEHGYGLSMASDNQINIADQVLYEVTGYDAGSASLLLELVEDWRKPGVLTFDRKLTEAEVEDIKARWREAHGTPGTAHVVREIRRNDPSVQCWHTEPNTPCDWDVCRQPERLAAGDRGTDPARKEPS